MAYNYLRFCQCGHSELAHDFSNPQHHCCARLPQQDPAYLRYCGCFNFEEHPDSLNLFLFGCGLSRLTDYPPRCIKCEAPLHRCKCPSK